MNQILDHPIDHDNEALVIANALKSEKNRELLIRSVSYDKFRVKEFKTLAWGIIESSRSGLEINLDAVLLKSKTCPTRQIIDFDFIQQLINNFSEVPEDNFKDHIVKLNADHVKAKLSDWVFESFYKRCLDPMTGLSDLAESLSYAKGVVDKGFSLNKLDFANMEIVAARFEEEKSKGIDIRTTGFTQLDRYLTEGLKAGQITTVAALSSVGKCERKGALIMMFAPFNNCYFKKVEDIKVGDLLMGPDSKPRKVLELSRGFGKLYRIKQARGDDYFVNENHILSLKKAGAAIRTRGGARKGCTVSAGWKENGEILNISVKDALKQSGNFFNKYRGYKTSLQFEDKEVKVDPYFIGVWIGNGNNSGVTITTPDIEIKEYLKNYANELEMLYHEDVTDSLHCKKCRISEGRGNQKNVLLDVLRFYNLIENKHIPKEYLFNSWEKRMELLAGLLDTDGYVTSKIHEIVTKYSKLKDDILFLGRSLGFYCTVSYEKKTIKERNFEGMYWRIRVCGYNDTIPCKVKKKQATVRSKKHDPAHSTISIQPCENEEAYYGFELDGDGLYLHEDFTVTHNSSFVLSMMKNLSNKGVPSAQFALEMNSMSLFAKLLAFNTRLPISSLIKDPNNLSEEDRCIYNSEIARLRKNKHIFLNDKPSQSISNLREQIMLLQDFLYPNGGDGYIVVPIDLFGKLKDFQGSDNFARDYEKKCNEVQIMARELVVHLVLVAQINREVSKRKNKRPTMNDLKNSHALTEVSDLILGLHRPFYEPETALKYNTTYGLSMQDEDEENGGLPETTIEDNPDRNLAEVILLKQRMGVNNVLVNFTFDPNTTCFYPVVDEYQLKLNEKKFNDIGDD